MALSSGDKRKWAKLCRYEGDPEHKRAPGNFGLTPPAAPNFAKNLCDGGTVNVPTVEEAQELLESGIQRGLVSAKLKHGYPSRIWAVRADGAVFEARYGGSREGRYHGHPLFEGDANYDMVLEAWEARSP